MLDLNCYLSENQYTLVRRLNEKEHSQVVLLSRAGGTRFVCRIYDREVSGYEAVQTLCIPELPRVFQCKSIDGNTVVEEEFIDGISLAEILKCSLANDSQTAAIAMRVCAALNALHSKEIIHRDIKPEHVLITAEGRVVLIDLDAAVGFNPEKSRDTQLLGTVGYAAPEQFGLARSDARADIFGLGVMMNVMLTGKHPANGLTEGDLLPVIEKCIEVNINKRYPSVAELSAQLEKFCKKENRCSECGCITPGGGCLYCCTESATPILSGNSTRNHYWIAAIATCVCCLLILFGTLLDRENPLPAHSKQQPMQTVPESLQAEQITNNQFSDEPQLLENNAAATTASQETSSITQSPVQDENSQPPADNSVSLPQQENETIEQENTQAPHEESIPEQEEPTAENTETDTLETPTATTEIPAVDTYVPTDIPSIQERVTAFDRPIDCSPTPFLYDCDRDGVAEQYYLGVARLAQPAKPYSAYYYIPEERVEVAESSAPFNETVAAAAFIKHEDGRYILAEEFSLGDPEITIYYRNAETEPEALPHIAAGKPILNVWGQAETFQYTVACAGQWVITCSTTISGTVYSTMCTTEIIRQPHTYIASNSSVLQASPDSSYAFRVATDESQTSFLDGNYTYTCDAGLGTVYWSESDNCLYWNTTGLTQGADGVLRAANSDGSVYSLSLKLEVNLLAEADTDGTPVDTALTVPFVTDFTSDEFMVHSITAQPLDNEHMRFRIEFTVPPGGRFAVFHPPNGELYRRVFDINTTGSREAVEFDVPFSYILEQQFLTASFYEYYGADNFVVMQLTDLRNNLQ